MAAPGLWALVAALAVAGAASATAPVLFSPPVRPPAALPGQQERAWASVSRGRLPCQGPLSGAGRSVRPHAIEGRRARYPPVGGGTPQCLSAGPQSGAGGSWLDEYMLVPAGESGTWTIRALSYQGDVVEETFHPSIGVVAEGMGLYVEQLMMRERWRAAVDARGEFVVWDVGLGGAGNAVVALNELDKAGCRRCRMVSFDRTLGALAFAVENADKLAYVRGWEGHIDELMRVGRASLVMSNGCEVDWEVHVGDFPTILDATALGDLPSADAVMYDAFSPARCWQMWTLPVLTRLREHASRDSACMLSTSSRSTIVRVSLLCAGFYVGVGGATGGTAFRAKEETTTASTELSLLPAPLQASWLDRVRRSSAAEPLRGQGYVRSSVSEETLALLVDHPQFCD